MREQHVRSSFPHHLKYPAVAMASISLAACNTQLGQGGSMASGSAGQAGSQGEQAKIKKCSQPVGTAALHTPDNSQHVRADLPAPTQVMNLIMQQSGCFKLVSSGSSMDAIKSERELGDEGELQSDSDMGQAQVKVADFLLEPAVLFKDTNAGGGGTAIGSLLGPLGAIIGGSLQSKQAQILLTLTNVRTSVQEAVAEGSAEKYDIGGVFGAFGGGVAGAAGAYESTDIGKLVMAALIESYNKLATQLDATKAAHERESVAKWETAARVNLRAGPGTDTPVLTTLSKGTSCRPIGDEQDQWWEVKVDGNQVWISSDYVVESQ